VGLTACSSADDELSRFIDDTKREPGGRVQPLPEVRPYETFSYSAAELRSPFLPSGPGSGAGLAGVRPDSKRNREFLEQFSLDTLRMVGTLKLTGRMYGLVQTKDGLVHRVSSGNYMGQADGKVTDISASKISLVEIVPDGLGGYMERPAALALNE
jgi:type IV pilus assembly protein PilP